MYASSRVSTLRRRLVVGLVAGALTMAFWQPSGMAQGQKEAPKAANPAVEKEPVVGPPARLGRTLRIRLPITGTTYDTVRRFALRVLDEAKSAGARPVLILEFEVPRDGQEFAASSEFGASYQLADFLSSAQLNEATTVAYVPEPIQGHAVLVALACEELLMGPNAELGPAGVHEPTITAPLRSAYKEIADRRKTVPAEVALGLLDPARKVLVVETDISREYVSPEQLEELRKTRTIQSSRTLFEAGQPGRLSADEARNLDLIDVKADSRRDVARALELRPDALQDDPSLGGQWRAVRVDVKGTIHAELVRRAQRLIEDAMRKRQANFVCVWIDSPGGSPTDSIELASFLADLDASKVRTVAYIPSQALSDAALVAAACDQIVMKPEAVLGGSGEHEPSPEELALVRTALRQAIAPAKERSWSLPVALMDSQWEVFRYTRKGGGGVPEYFSEEELAAQPNPGQWEIGERITQPGKPLQVTGKQAADLWLANHTVDGFGEFKRLYGLENDPWMLESGWADAVIDALASPGAAVLLLIIAFVAVYAELHTPGMGIAGFIAAVCFLLFFWSRFLGGTAVWLEVLLFMLGVVFLMLEVFVLPGFGIFGLGGGALILISLILASQTFVFPQNEYQFAELQRTLLILAAAGAGTVAIATFLNRWLPKTPLFSGMVLAPPEGEEAAGISQRESLSHFENLVGQQGTTTTPLVPAGKARIGEQLVDVIADGEFIPRGAEVVVVEAYGNRILVRARETS